MANDHNPDGGAITHPEEIRLEAEWTVTGRATARAAIRTTPAGVICAGLALAVIVVATAAAGRILRRRV